MRTFLSAVAIGLVLVVIEWVGLSAITHDLSRDMRQAHTQKQIHYDDLSVGQRYGHSLGADYVQASSEDGSFLQPSIKAWEVQ